MNDLRDQKGSLHQSKSRLRHRRMKLLGAWFLVLLLLPASAKKKEKAVSLAIELGPEVQLIEGGTFPYMFRSREGTLALLAYVPAAEDPARQARSPNGVPRTILSTDNGKTWHQWNPRPDQGFGPMMEGSAVQTRDGSILVFDYVPESKGNGKLVNRRWQSKDQWKTFQGPEESHIEVPQAIDGGTADNGQPIAPILFHRSVIELPNGDLLAGVYGWFKGDDSPSEYRFEMKKFRSLLLRSTDRGRHWKYLSTIAVDPNIGQEGFPEPVLLRLTQGRHKGRILCLMRTGRKNPIYQAESDDEGRTWTSPRSLDLIGVDPDLIEMDNGVLVCSFGHKPDFKDDGNFLAFSLDQGKTWTHVTRLSSVLTCAYTTVRQIGPNELFVVYDERDPKDYRSKNRRILGRQVHVTTP